jgi:glycosyltransferase involved in cell wall biosynthesis
VIENKVIYIAHNWSDASVSFQSKALALAFSNKNEVYFLNAKKNGFKHVSINQNLKVLEWPGKRPTGWRDLLFALKLMRKNKPDIIITNFAANDIMLFVSWLFGVKYRLCYFHTLVEQYIADHGRLPLNQKINIFRKSLVFKMATHMLPCSTAAKKDLIHYYKIKESRAIVFPNALPDTETRNKSNSKKIGFLGRLDPSKGVDILIEAFAKVLKEMPDAILEIGGKGSQENNLMKQVCRLNLANNVIFKGLVSYTHVREFLSSLHFLVVPSRTDNLPTVALEAFAVATPVIGSNSGGIPDIITNGYNGLLFDAGNAEDLAQKILQLFADKKQRDVMSLNARKTFEEKYCVDELPLRFEQLLEVKTQDASQKTNFKKQAPNKLKIKN